MSQIAESICVEKLNLMFLYDYVKDKSIKREINEIIELMISLENKIDALNEKQKD